MASKKKWNIAIIGATGLVGREMLSILEERKFPVNRLHLYASKESEGSTLSFLGKNYPVKALTEESVDDFKNIDVALMSVGKDLSRLYAPLLGKRGTVCIDNSNAWRMDPAVPLIVPEVNYSDIKKFRKSNIIANPNCSTIQMVQVLKPIYDRFGIRRVVVSTYQSTSGKGKSGIDELAKQTIDLLNHRDVKPSVFAHQIAFNCIPHIDRFMPNGYTLEETKMIQETQKILNNPDIRVTATCVRVPVFSGHSESVNIETEHKATAGEIRKLLSSSKGLKVVDDPKKNLYPLTIESTGKDETFVGRIREDESIDHGINLWIVSDNLRKGAALNAVQIAEAVVNEFL